MPNSFVGAIIWIIKTERVADFMRRRKLFPVAALMIFLILLGIDTTRRAEPTFTVIRGSAVISEHKSDKLNINTASAEELCELPGIGKVLSERIVGYRESHGNFASIEEITKVSGIGEKKLAAMRDLICAE